MDYLSKNISINLKSIRKGKKMSLDDVAEQTGVSKSMLGQIERGDSNPTISTIGKIVSGLRVSIDDLIEAPSHETYIVNKDTLTPSKDSEGNYKIHTFFPFSKHRNFEIYNIEIQPNSVYYSGSHGERTGEYIIINQGILTLKIEDEIFEVNEGDALFFESDKPHQYINNSDEILSFNAFFVFKKKY